jgi:hypothetical protein
MTVLLEVHYEPVYLDRMYLLVEVKELADRPGEVFFVVYLEHRHRHDV